MMQTTKRPADNNEAQTNNGQRIPLCRLGLQLTRHANINTTVQHRQRSKGVKPGGWNYHFNP